MRSVPTTALIVCICGLCATSARAQTTIHATAELTAAYNDNILGAPSQPWPDSCTPAGEPAPEYDDPVAAFMLSPTPGAALFHDAGRARFAVTYAHPFIFYMGPDVPSDAVHTSADIGSAVGIFTLTPREELTTEIFVNRFTPTLSTLTAPSETPAGATSPDDLTRLTLGLNEGLTSELTTRWALLQTFGIAVTAPIEEPDPPQDPSVAAPVAPPTVLTTMGSIGPELTLGNHAIAVLPGALFIRRFVSSDADAATDSGLGEDVQVVVNTPLRWRWDWTPSWGSEASAGIGVVFDDEGNRAVWPILGSAILFREAGYEASLRYTRAVAPSLLTGQTFYSDTLLLSGGIPIWEEADLELQTSTSISWSRIVNEEQTFDSDSVNTFIADVGVGWFPDELPFVALRYQRTQQFFAHDCNTALPNFARNVASLTVGFMYPPRDIVVPTGPPARVDGTDRDPTAPGGSESQPTSRPQPQR